MSVTAGSESRIDLELAAAGVLTGKVVAPDGAGVPRVWVYAIATGDPLPRPDALAHYVARGVKFKEFDRVNSTPGWVFVRTDADGAFRFRALLTDRVNLSVNTTVDETAQRFRGAKRDGVRVPSKDVVLRLELGARLSGRIVNEDGSPWNGDGGKAEAKSEWVKTFSYGGIAATDGHFEITGLAPIPHDVTFHHDVAGDAEPARIDVRPGNNEVTLRLRAAAQASGRIVSRGIPVAGVWVGPGSVSMDGLRFEFEGQARAARTTVDGRFEVKLPPARNGLFVFHPEYEPEIRRNLDIPAGARRELGDIEVRPGTGRELVWIVGNVGLVLECDGIDACRVARIADRSPAAVSEVNVGDTLLAVEDTSTRGLSSDEVDYLLRGTPGTTVTVRMERSTRARPWQQVFRRSVYWE